VNETIRAREVRVVFPDGETEVLPTHVGIERAKAMGLDLVVVSPTAVPPVAKVIDHGECVLANDDCNIATMSVSRKGKHDLACLVIEMDSGIKAVTLDYLRSLSWVKKIIYIPDIDQ
jgi:hypothetical protein